MRIFVRMMTQRNVELQLQALDVIERRHLNSTSTSIDDGGDGDATAGPSSANVSIDKSIPEQEQEEELDEVIQEEMKWVFVAQQYKSNLIWFDCVDKWEKNIVGNR